MQCNSAVGDVVIVCLQFRCCLLKCPSTFSSLYRRRVGVGVCPQRNCMGGGGGVMEAAGGTKFVARVTRVLDDLA